MTSYAGLLVTSMSLPSLSLDPVHANQYTELIAGACGSYYLTLPFLEAKVHDTAATYAHTQSTSNCWPIETALT